jgi:hypothetical protein
MGISESVSSLFNALRRHFRVSEPVQPFAAEASKPPSFSRPLRFGPRRGGKSTESDSNLSPRETSGFAARVVSP